MLGRIGRCPNAAAPAMPAARERLLPVSIPFRLFIAVAGCHLSFWLAAAYRAAPVATFQGGPGLVLARLHRLTLGVLAMPAVGASLPLLAVATRNPVGGAGVCRLESWLLIPGVAVLSAGMAGLRPLPLLPGATRVTLGLLVFPGLVLRNLWRAPVLGVVSAYTGAALVALAIVVALGSALAGNYCHGYLADHRLLAPLRWRMRRRLGGLFAMMHIG